MQDFNLQQSVHHFDWSILNTLMSTLGRVSTVIIVANGDLNK